MKGNEATSNGRKNARKGDLPTGLYFLGGVVLLYLVLSLFRPQCVLKSVISSGNLLITIIPLLFLVIFFTAIINHLITPKMISKYVGKDSGIKGWLIAIAAGIFSHGPIYLWFPLFKGLRNQGMSSGLVAASLYNRAIKIPLLPLMVHYFGLLFVGVLMIYMIIASVVEGKLIDMVEKHEGSRV